MTIVRKPKLNGIEIVREKLSTWETMQGTDGELESISEAKMRIETCKLQNRHVFLTPDQLHKRIYRGLNRL